MKPLSFVPFPLIMLLSLLALSACVATYTHPTRPASRFESDEADCKRQAQRIVAKKQAQGHQCSVCDEIDRCLKNKGWRTTW